jgi:hypothetical protein
VVAMVRFCAGWFGKKPPGGNSDVAPKKGA